MEFVLRLCDYHIIVTGKEQDFEGLLRHRRHSSHQDTSEVRTDELQGSLNVMTPNTEKY